MILDDCCVLNDRFVKVFKIFEERGDVIKNDCNGKGFGDFVEKIVGNCVYGYII